MDSFVHCCTDICMYTEKLILVINYQFGFNYLDIHIKTVELLKSKLSIAYMRAKDSQKIKIEKRQRLPGSLMKGGIPRNGCLTQWRRR